MFTSDAGLNLKERDEEYLGRALAFLCAIGATEVNLPRVPCFNGWAELGRAGLGRPLVSAFIVLTGCRALPLLFAA